MNIYQQSGFGKCWVVVQARWHRHPIPMDCQMLGDVFVNMMRGLHMLVRVICCLC